MNIPTGYLGYFFLGLAGCDSTLRNVTTTSAFFPPDRSLGTIAILSEDFLDLRKFEPKSEKILRR
jgi:hypothetical protein